MTDNKTMLKKNGSQSVNVLIVDDNEELVDLIAAFLCAKGCSVDRAADGKRGFDKYMENPEKYDVILMDIQMPVMDGYETVKCIRESKQANAASVPVIAISGDTRRIAENCFDALLRKPFSYDVLYERIIDIVKE